MHASIWIKKLKHLQTHVLRMHVHSYQGHTTCVRIQIESGERKCFAALIVCICICVDVLYN